MSESLPDEITPALAAVGAVQLALLVIGLRVLWVVLLSPAARATAGPRLGRWNLPILDFVAAAVMVLIGGTVAQLTTALALRAEILPAVLADPELSLVLQGAAFQIGLLVGAFFAALYTRSQSAPSSEASVPAKTPALPAGLLAFLAAMPVVTALNLGWNGILSFFNVEAPPQELVFLMVEAESPLTSALLIIFAVGVAPLAEEIVFRAGLFRYLRGRVPRVVAYLLPAVIFGALHANLAAFVPLTVLGVAFAVAYERTGNIAVPIIAHSLFNLNTVALLFAGVAV